MKLDKWKKIVSIIGLATQTYGSIINNPYLILIGGISAGVGIMLIFRK